MRLLPALAFALLLAGCSSNGERAYYQTRYIPSSGDALYTPSEKSRWRGDHEVYELVAAPPALAEEHRARRDCERPGSAFPVNGVAAYGDIKRGTSHSTLQPAGGFDSRPATGSGPLTHDAQLMSATGDIAPAGLAQRNHYTKAGAFDDRARVGKGPDTIPPQLIHDMRDQDKWDYCLEPHATPLTANDRSRGVAAPAAR